MFKRTLVSLVMLFLVLSLIPAALADFGDEATIGGQDSSGNYRWRVTEDGDLIPGTTSVNDIGSSSKYVDKIYGTTLYLDGKFASQGSEESTDPTLQYDDITEVVLDYGVINYQTDATCSIVHMPDGEYAGQKLTIILNTYGGGNVTIDGSFTTTSGWATAYLNAAGDSITLEWRGDTIGWVIDGQYGITISATQ